MASQNPASEIPPCGCAAPGTAAFGSCYCSVEDLLRLIRRRYSLAVLNAVQSHGTARFNDVETSLHGISTSTLSETLRALVAAGLLERGGSPDSVPRSDYAVTPAGAKLLHKLRRLLDEVRET